MHLGVNFNHHRLTTPVYCRTSLRGAKPQVTPSGEIKTAFQKIQNSAHPQLMPTRTLKFQIPSALHKGTLSLLLRCLQRGNHLKSPALSLPQSAPPMLCTPSSAWNWDPFLTPQIHQLNYYASGFLGDFAYFHL